jgi:hypothetical protein
VNQNWFFERGAGMKSKVKSVAIVVAIVVNLVCGVTMGQTEIRLGVSAVGADLVDVPVHAAIKLPEEFANMAVEQIAVAVKQQDKDVTVPGQIVMEDGQPQLWWILPSTKKDVATTWTAKLTRREKTDSEGFVWKDTLADHLDLLLDGRRVMQYVYARDSSTPQRSFETSKPFYNFFDADGRNLITNCDPNSLYPHHRGLFIGWSRMEFGGKEYDFWGMTRGNTAQVHQGFLGQTAGPVLAKSSALINWADSNDGTIISEKRQVTVFRQPAPAIALLEFKTELKAVNGDVLLISNKGEDAQKAPEHGGIHYRPHNDTAAGSARSATYTEKVAEEDKVKYLFHQDGIDSLKDKDLPWVAMSHGLKGRHYSVLHINHPENPSPTVYSAYRDYGRFGAYFEKKIQQGQTLTLRYYLWVTESRMPARDELAARYQAMIKPPAVEVLTR